MKLVRIEEARAGSRVARDVTDLRGQLLFPSGTPLTDTLIDRCRQRNVTHLFVDEAADAPAPIDPAEIARRREAIERDLEAAFAGTAGQPLMSALRDAARQYLLSRIS